MSEINPETILAANAVENDAMDTNPAAETTTAATSVPAVAADATAAAAAVTVAATPTTNADATNVAAVAPALATTNGAAAAVAAVPAATEAPVPNRPFSFKWLQAADKNRQHFADELFNTAFTQENIEKVVQELKTITATKIANSFRLCEDDHTYSVQIATHGWLRVPTHLMRIELPYSVLADDSAICLFVRDLKKPPTTPGRNAKQPNLADLTVKHYEQLLTAAKVDISNVTVIPLSQLFNEHTSLDQRRKLTYLYDKFLVEAPVATRVNAFLGSKLLYEARAAFPVDLRSDDLASEFDVVVRQVFYQSHQASDHQFVRPQVCVGRESQDVAQVAENIIDLFGQLGSLQPGGAPNISGLFLRASGNVATSVELWRDPTTSAPEIPAPEAPQPVMVRNADGTESVAPAAEKLTVSVPNLTQHIIDNQHYIVFDGEDDYAEEFGVDLATAQRQQLEKLQRGGAPEPQKRRMLVGAGGNQLQQQQQQQQQQVSRAGPSGVKKVLAATGGVSEVDQLVMRGLKKLLAQQNLAGLIGDGQVNQVTGNNMRRMQNGGGGYVMRRPMNQQMQQQQMMQPQQQQQRGGGGGNMVVGRNAMGGGGGNVQRRRNVYQMNGSNGGMRNNRRFI